MRYVGGKFRQAKHVCFELKRRKKLRTRYIEPMMGGGAVFAKAAPLFKEAIGADVVEDLMLFWMAVRDGWTPPIEVSKDDYERLLNEGPSALRGWVGFVASYNGRWWGGYGPKAAGRDYLAESYRSTMKKAAGMTHADFVCCPYWEHEVDANTAVYCDPPYEHTTGNNHSGRKTPEGSSDGIYGTEHFDHARFWVVMEEWVQKGALVLVHEYDAPEGWERVCTTGRVETMNHRGQSSGSRKESLWTRGVA